jgi:hypothetical protein
MIIGAAPALSGLALAKLDLGRSSFHQSATAVTAFQLAPPALDLHIEDIALRVPLLDNFGRDQYPCSR